MDDFKQIKLRRERSPRNKEFSFSDQAQGALMMALQKCLLEQSDITEILKSFVLLETNGEIYVKNPPLVKLDQEPE